MASNWNDGSSKSIGVWIIFVVQLVRSEETVHWILKVWREFMGENCRKGFELLQLVNDNSAHSNDGVDLEDRNVNIVSFAEGVWHFVLIWVRSGWRKVEWVAGFSKRVQESE